MPKIIKCLYINQLYSKQFILKNQVGLLHKTWYAEMKRTKVVYGTPADINVDKSTLLTMTLIFEISNKYM